MFTDLRDRTGKEIYEGDIVECCSWNEYFSDSSGVMKPFIRKFVVVWFNGAFMLEERYDGNILPPSHFEIHDSTDLKVIGNIFDNEDDIEKAIRIWNGGPGYTKAGTEGYYRKIIKVYNKAGN